MSCVSGIATINIFKPNIIVFKATFLRYYARLTISTIIKGKTFFTYSGIHATICIIRVKI